MPPTGRPLTLTPALQERIVDLVKGGLAPERAAQSVGVGRTTYYRWMQQGAEEHHPDPTAYTLPQLRKMAADQHVPLGNLGPKPTRAAIANLLTAPSPFRDFRHAIKTAEAAAEGYILGRCIAAGGDDWRMWMTILERRFGWVRPEQEQQPAAGQGTVDPHQAIAGARARLLALQGGRQ